MKTIDFRSDTVTRPTEAMRAAMASAEVGDDVYGEDPTVLRLQELAANRLGVEAAIFVPSGTMANQAAIRCLTVPGDILLAGENAHVLRYEGGAASALSGVQIQTVGAGGFFDADDLLAALPPDDPHFAPVTAVALENTHNDSGGRVWPAERVAAIASSARDRGLHLHLDGARIFNAAVASGRSVAELAAPFDLVSFCLSKGLGAPVGSLVCGSADRIHRIHRIRKQLGGGMRQVGILAAAGIHALEHHVERLADDHANAARLAEGLQSLGLEVDGKPETNIVMFRLPASLAHRVGDTAGFGQRLRERKLLINRSGPGRFRAVTHLDVESDDIDDAISRLADAIGR